MKNEKVLSRAFNSIVVIIIISVLGLAIFLVHRTFEKSTEADIFRYTREIEESVRRSTGAEFRRYLLLIDLAKSIESEVSEVELTATLEEKSNLLGQDGDIPNMVSSIGYFNRDSPQTAFEYDFGIGEWLEVNGIFDKKETNRGFENGYIAVDNADSQRVIFFKLDSPGFIENYIKKIVEAANEGFSFEWGRRPDDAIKLDPEKYTFRPLRILLGNKGDAHSLIIELPGIYEIKRMMNRMDDNTDDMHGQKSDPPAFLNSGSFVKMSHKSGSYYFDIEHRSAVNFMETVVIFIIIGILFVLLLLQLDRTRRLRSKEKEFVASITHELRTPLTVIRSAADNIVTGIVPVEKLKTYGGLITDQSDRLGNMIEEILLYSKFEDKRRKPEEPVPVDMLTLVAQIKPLLGAVAQPGGIQLHWDTDGLPESLESHPDVISLGINNLVTNAVNHAYFGKTGEIRISFRYLIPGKLQITVEDDGRGIEPREQKSIFEPFYRDRFSRERQEKGSGLGLFIIKRKVAVLGGRLTVESPYRRIDGSKPSGCRFTMTLPGRIIQGESKTKGIIDG